MRMIDMTRKLTFSVPCPTCGVGVEQDCLLDSGAVRSEPHVNRKLVAVETLETKKNSPG